MTFSEKTAFGSHTRADIGAVLNSVAMMRACVNNKGNKMKIVLLACMVTMFACAQSVAVKAGPLDGCNNEMNDCGEDDTGTGPKVEIYKGPCGTLISKVQKDDQICLTVDNKCAYPLTIRFRELGVSAGDGLGSFAVGGTAKHHTEKQCVNPPRDIRYIKWERRAE
ncbi:MAG: hypothetical protein WA384_05175 [Rhodomicrobium sp.]